MSHIDDFEKRVTDVEWFVSREIKEINKKPSITFAVPKARKSVNLSINETNPNLERILKTQFDKFRYLEGFEAIWSEELKQIECEIEIENTLVGSLQLLRIIKKIFDQKNSSLHLEDLEELEDVENKNVDEIVISTSNKFVIKIGIASEEFKSLYSMKSMTPFERLKDIITIKITNIKFKKHDDALNYLLKISNSLFFEIIYIIDVSIKLKNENVNARDQVETIKEYINKSKSNESLLNESLILRNEYDNDSISQYLHGKNNTDLPLFKYLSLYHTVEYYFPVYSNIEAKQNIKKVLKEPGFDPDSDTKLSKVISAIKINRTGDIGDERAQLKNTLKHCITEEEFRELKNNNKKLSSYFSGKDCAKISSKRIGFDNNDFEVIINDIAERIYDIRCKIVHKKSNATETEIILPYSSDNKYFNRDIELLDFVAKSVLISNSKKFKI